VGVGLLDHRVDLEGETPRFEEGRDEGIKLDNAWADSVIKSNPTLEK